VPRLADVAGAEQPGAEETREARGPPGQLRTPLLELVLAARRDTAGDGDGDRVAGTIAAPATAAVGTVLGTGQPTSASQSRFSRLSRMCMRNIDAVEPSNARWS
jgi:hypothetical protein